MCFRAIPLSVMADVAKDLPGGHRCEASARRVAALAPHVQYHGPAHMQPRQPAVRYWREWRAYIETDREPRIVIAEPDVHAIVCVPYLCIPVVGVYKSSAPDVVENDICGDTAREVDQQVSAPGYPLHGP